jgi:hypothetical protein
MGITLQNLYAETTDEQWNPAFVKTYSQLIYKVWCSVVWCSAVQCWSVASSNRAQTIVVCMRVASANWQSWRVLGFGLYNLEAVHVHQGAWHSISQYGTHGRMLVHHIIHIGPLMHGGWCLLDARLPLLTTKARALNRCRIYNTSWRQSHYRCESSTTHRPFPICQFQRYAHRSQSQSIRRIVSVDAHANVNLHPIS